MSVGSHRSFLSVQPPQGDACVITHLCSPSCQALIDLTISSASHSRNETRIFSSVKGVSQ